MNPNFDIQSVACCRLHHSPKVAGRIEIFPPGSVLAVCEHRFVSRRKFDWTEIRAYYEAGHTFAECESRFGFSKGAWDSAVAWGEIVPRGRADQVRTNGTREAVAQLLAGGKSQTQIAFELGLSKATVCYHVRQLGKPRDSRFAKRYDWAAIQAAHDAGLGRRQCLQKFGCSSAAWYDAVRRGLLKPRSTLIPIEELLVAGTPRGRGHVKARLLREGLKDGNCEECGITEWREKPIVTTLHHVNGDPNDHRLENQRFLCPNCHSQTSNYGGRNGHLRPRGERDAVAA